MSEPTATPPRRRRRWFSLSLRTLMILVLVVGGFMGWKARRASLQRRAVARIQYLRGSVAYDWQLNNSPFALAPPPVVTPQPHGPDWLRKIVGDEYFQEVVWVELGSPDESQLRAYDELVRLRRERQRVLDKDQLACLDGLDRIESLNLSLGTVRAELKSEGLARLGRLSRLKVLTIDQPLTEEGVAQISRLTDLECLSTSFKLTDDSALALLERLPRLKTLLIIEESWFIPLAKISDAWLTRLGRLHQLNHLHLGGSGITDAGLAHLKGLDQLESLSVGVIFDTASPLITDAGLALLAGLKSLKALNFLSASEIGDAGLAHLVGLKKLERLGLSRASKVTDAGLAHLVEFENLESLDLYSASKVTEAGIAHLAKLPRLTDLVLNNQSLSDAGLARIQSMKNLSTLVLTGPKVKGEILDRIQAANPGLLIDAERMDDGSTPDAGKQSSDLRGITPPPTPEPFDGITPPPAFPRS
jgi:hypothetical protein